METPKSILQWLVTHADLCGKWLLAQIHQGAANRKVLINLIIHVQAKHRLSLHSVGIVALYGSTDVCT